MTEIRIVVTGGTGFISRESVRTLLASEHEVYARAGILGIISLRPPLNRDTGGYE
jgi:hypothetical protein